MNKFLMIGLFMAVAVASTSEFQSAEGTFVPEDTAVTHETPKEELTQSHFFKNHAKRMERAVKKHHANAKKVEHRAKLLAKKAKHHAKKKAKHHAKKVERVVKNHAKKVRHAVLKKHMAKLHAHHVKKAVKSLVKNPKAIKSLVKKLVKKHMKKQMKQIKNVVKKHIHKHVLKYHKRRPFSRTVGPTGHFVRGNSKFENSHDRRVDDVDDTTSPWACSVNSSPWFACIPRKGDTTNIHRYRTKNPHGRRTWECSIDKSMWYPCKARRRDILIRHDPNYVAHYPPRLPFGKATKQWLKKRNLYFRPKTPSFHGPQGPKIRSPRFRTRRL